MSIYYQGLYIHLILKINIKLKIFKIINKLKNADKRIKILLTMKK